MTIDTSYLNKYAYQLPLEGNTSSGGTSASSGLYCVNTGINSTNQGNNTFLFNTPMSLDSYDSFNYSPCFGIGTDMDIGLNLNFPDSSFTAPPAFNFDFGGLLNSYNSYMQNIMNNSLWNIGLNNQDFNVPGLKLGPYTPAQRVLYKRNNDDYIKELQPLMQEKVRLLESYAKSKGYPFKICSGYRSREEQIALQKKYANQPGRAAGADSSPHRFGRAIDISTNGLMTEAQCADLGSYAKSIGLRWGGDFKTCRECWHFDLPANAKA